MKRPRFMILGVAFAMAVKDANGGMERTALPLMALIMPAKSSAGTTPAQPYKRALSTKMEAKRPFLIPAGSSCNQKA